MMQHQMIANDTYWRKIASEQELQVNLLASQVRELRAMLPPPVAAGVRAGALLVTPLGAVGGSIGVVFLEQSTRLGSPLRSILRSGEGSMTCARVPCGRREVTGSM